MTHLGYLIAVRLLKRGARLSARVPAQNARWMSSPKQNGG